MTTIITYDRLEDHIVERLAGLQQLGFKVQHLPETEKELNRPAGHYARVTVAYGGSNFGDGSDTRNPNVLTTGVVSQHEYCDLVIAFEGQRLRTNRGLYEAVRQARKMLLGHHVPGWSKIFFKTLQFEKHMDGMFVFHLTISCYRTVIESVNELGQQLDISGNTETAYPNFTEGKANLNLG